jgi:hypothetical protein
MGILSNVLLNIQWLEEDIASKIRKYFEVYENGNIAKESEK